MAEAFIATTVSELARALLARAARGEIWLHRIDEPQRTGVVIVFHIGSEAGQGTMITATKWCRRR